MDRIKALLDAVDLVRDNVALGLMSHPGLSKTSQVKQWAEENGRRYCELIISQRMPSEISGMPMPVQETRTMEVFDFQTLLELKDGDVLAFDEFTNGNIQTLNACLTLIQERTMLSGKKLPSLLIVAMGNPQGRCELLPQTKQRFLWVEVLWSPKAWVDYMQDTWGFTPKQGIVDAITTQYDQGFRDQDQFNYWTPRTVENLFRLATKIDKDHPVWSSLDAPFYVDDLYESMKVREIDRIKKVLLKELESVEIPEEYVDRIKRCSTFRELKTVVKSMENDSKASVIVQVLKKIPSPTEAE